MAGMRGLRGPQQYRHMRSLRPAWALNARRPGGGICWACGQQRTVAKITAAWAGLRIVLPAAAASVRALRAQH
jgi:hypothetical protein